MGIPQAHTVHRAMQGQIRRGDFITVFCIGLGEFAATGIGGGIWTGHNCFLQLN